MMLSKFKFRVTIICLITFLIAVSFTSSSLSEIKDSDSLLRWYQTTRSDFEKGICSNTIITDDGQVKLNPNPNLLKNSSFEEGNNFPSGWKKATLRGAAVEWESGSDKIRSGKKSLKLSNEGNGKAVVTYSNPVFIPIKPNTHYVASVWVKTENVVGERGAYIKVEYYDENKKYITQGNAYLKGTNDWTKITVTKGFRHQPERNRYLVIRLQLYKATGTAWFDDINLVTPEEPKQISGTYFSCVHRAGEVTDWGLIRWKGQIPSGAKIGLQTRTGPTPAPDSSWSDWSNTYSLAEGQPVSSPPNRYIQYKINFLASSPSLLPVLDEVSIEYRLKLTSDDSEFNYEPLFHFIQLTDPHGTRAVSQVIEEINELKPAFVLVTGDLAEQPGENVFSSLKKLFSKFDMPVYVTPGNHDLGVWAGHREKLPAVLENLKKYEEYLGKSYYSFDYNTTHFIALETNLIAFYPNEKKVQEMWTEQLAWLRADLVRAKKSDTKHIFIFCHVLVHRNELISLIEEFGISAVFAGHIHKNIISRHKGTEFITTASIAWNFKDETGQKIPPGYRVITVYDDHIAHQYLKIGDGYHLDLQPKYSRKIAWRNEGIWLKGDTHIHTTASDGSHSVDTVAGKAMKFGCDYIAITNHGYAYPKVVEQQYTQIKIARNKYYPDLLIFHGVEWDMCAGHANLILPKSPYENMILDEFLKKYDSKLTKVGTFEETIAGLKYLERKEFNGLKPFVHINHSPKGLDLWRAINDVSNICIGFEIAGAHQGKAASRGVYSSLVAPGKAWDQLLDEGRKWHIFLNSDFHKHLTGKGMMARDWWPGEFWQTRIYAPSKTYEGVIKAYHAGAIYTVMNNIVENLDCSVSTIRGAATIGEEIVCQKGDAITFFLRIKPNTPLEQIDLISNIEGVPALVKSFRSGEWWVDAEGWYNLQYRFLKIEKSFYIRIQGRSIPCRVPHIDGDPESMYFGTDCIRIKIN